MSLTVSYPIYVLVHPHAFCVVATVSKRMKVIAKRGDTDILAIKINNI